MLNVLHQIKALKEAVVLLALRLKTVEQTHVPDVATAPYKPDSPDFWGPVPSQFVPATVQQALDDAADYFPRQVPRRVVVSTKGVVRGDLDPSHPGAGTEARPVASLAAAKALLWPNGGESTTRAEFEQQCEIVLVGGGTLVEDVTLPTSRVTVFALGDSVLQGTITYDVKASRKFGSTLGVHFKLKNLGARTTSTSGFVVGGLNVAQTLGDTTSMIVRCEGVQFVGNFVSMSLASVIVQASNCVFSTVLGWDGVSVGGMSLSADFCSFTGVVGVQNVGVIQHCDFRQSVSTAIGAGSGKDVGLRNCRFSGVHSWLIVSNELLPMDSVTFASFSRNGWSMGTTGQLFVVDLPPFQSSEILMTNTVNLTGAVADTPLLTQDGGTALNAVVTSPQSVKAHVRFSVHIIADTNNVEQFVNFKVRQNGTQIAFRSVFVKLGSVSSANMSVERLVSLAAGTTTFDVLVSTSSAAANVHIAAGTHTSGLHVQPVYA